MNCVSNSPNKKQAKKLCKFLRNKCNEYLGEREIYQITVRDEKPIYIHV